MCDAVRDDQQQQVRADSSSQAGSSTQPSRSAEQPRAASGSSQITQGSNPSRTLEPDPRIGPKPKQAPLAALWDRGFSDDPSPGDDFFRRGLPVAQPHVTTPVINEIPPTPICSPPSVQHSLNNPNTSQGLPTSPRPNRSPPRSQRSLVGQHSLVLHHITFTASLNAKTPMSDQRSNYPNQGQSSSASQDGNARRPPIGLPGEPIQPYWAQGQRPPAIEPSMNPGPIQPPMRASTWEQNRPPPPYQSGYLQRPPDPRQYQPNPQPYGSNPQPHQQMQQQRQLNPQQYQQMQPHYQPSPRQYHPNPRQYPPPPPRRQTAPIEVINRIPGQGPGSSLPPEYHFRKGVRRAAGMEGETILVPDARDSTGLANFPARSVDHTKLHEDNSNAVPVTRGEYGTIDATGLYSELEMEKATDENEEKGKEGKGKEGKGKGKGRGNFLPRVVLYIAHLLPLGIEPKRVVSFTEVDAPD
ncbi:hypothetical protein M409DRAFT_53941 [Zasmidium cellare ATCC 36951]|uniref:Uncharacterized protein n=1 Tax=Zasmidium cellare ATCC 36951 TaxID=1080233 RepID=A0A6A6CJB8_ZASCE|nr:uncharacterized protein M409DRAFT_53941 [Zasmidium cellare ATCC 36951]KAF2167334.1 hypothetical protein M409DRAFT_53941 [Zasmidium cellare ATCC 36951]